MKRLLFLLFGFVLLSPTRAYDENSDLLPPVDVDTYPTYQALLDTELPAVDRADLAYRLQGVVHTPQTILSEPLRQLGDSQVFRIALVASGGIGEIEADLRSIGEHVYIWIQSGLFTDEAVLTTLTTRFDAEVYDFVRGLWGSEPSLGIDGDSRIHIVITDQLRRGTGGYFSARNAYAAEIAPNSNEMDMMVLNAHILSPQFLVAGINTAAHEFQHMIHHFNDTNEDNWLNEGFSNLTEHLLGFDGADFVLESFFDNPHTSLTHWGLGTNISAEYGAGAAFLIYLHDRYGLDAVQVIASDTANSLQSVDNTLLARGEASVDIIFADWVLANLLRDTQSIYGYRSLPDIDNVSLVSYSTTYPQNITHELGQYGTHYYAYSNLGDNFSISITMNETIGLTPINAASGRSMWYSQRGDNSNSRLTRAFDLREVDNAELNFDIWYDLETAWDYAYVTVSRDGGRSWEMQATDLMIYANPNERAYGVGYTGQSNQWLTDTLSLDAYVGEEILVRFEMVTDDAINHAGVALDNMRLDAIGYASDLENDTSGWVSEGWIHSDNRLPQRAWLQIVEFTDTTPIIHRVLVEGIYDWELNLNEATTAIVVAISPFAPMTNERATYTLQVE